MLIASLDRTAKLWCVASGECLRTLEGHQDVVSSAAFSSDGGLVLHAARKGLPSFSPTSLRREAFFCLGPKGASFADRFYIKLTEFAPRPNVSPFV